MNIVIDIGNSYYKVAVFQNSEIVFFERLESAETNDFIGFINKIKTMFPEVKNAILSSVKELDIEINKILTELFDLYINLNSETLIPIKIDYKTPLTLGKDRIAAVVGANEIFPENNVLVFDFGTALTIDFIDKNAEFKGGNISPGLEMRFKALNHFTDKLPKVSVNENFDGLLGNSTNNAILAGVRQGMIFEVMEYINVFTNEFADLKVIFTGGDNFFFANKLKSNIFADSQLVLKGLNRILEYNAK